MDELQKIFLPYREAVFAVKEDKIIWCNPAADSLFPNNQEKENIKNKILSALSESNKADCFVSAEMCGKSISAAASKLEDVFIISILSPDGETTEKMSVIFETIQASARSTMALYNMATSALRQHIEDAEDEKLSTYAAIQSHSYYSLAYIVNNISLMSLSGKELSDEKKGYFNILNTCNKIIDSVKPLLRYKNINISLESTEKNIIFFGNEEMIGLALIKLLSNSVKYTDKNGEVCISVYIREKYLVISVSDNGCGIEKDKMINIFNRYEMPKVYKNTKEGIGIGLFVVKQVASMHDGTALIESKVGEGTKVTMVMPMKERAKLMLRSHDRPYALSKHEILTEFSEAVDYKAYLPEIK